MSAKGPDRGPRLAELPVEPLSELSWQRIERGLFADGAIAASGGGAAPTRRRRVRLVAAGAVVVAAAAALALLVWPRGGVRDPVDAALPSRIVTADAPSSWSLGDVALDVGARSAVLVRREQGGAMMMVLERGETLFRVAPRDGRPAIVVHAGDARIEVVGTAFTVTRVGDSARVAVHEGVVAVIARGRRASVAAGHEWSGEAADAPPDRSGSLPAPPPPAAAEEQPERDRDARDTSDDRDGAGDGEPGAGKRVHRRRHTGTGRGAGASTQPPAGSSAASPTEPGTVAAASDDQQKLYERAARLEASRPHAALAIYARLADGRGPWAANALFAQARLELELRRVDRARRLLRSYLALHPRGPNAEDARQLLDRLHPSGAGAGEP